MQYVMDGLKLQGCYPGFLAGRDGILAADAALGGGDSCTIWSAFARRGLGFSATQGTTNRDDNTEAFDVPPHCAAPGAGLVGAKYSGDTLNVVDAGSAAPIQFSLGGDRGRVGYDYSGDKGVVAAGTGFGFRTGRRRVVGGNDGFSAAVGGSPRRRSAWPLPSERP